MIGMNQIKKRLINGILIGLAIGLVFVIITIIISNSIVSGYKEGTNKNFIDNYTTDVVTFSRDVVQGEKITQDMLSTTRVHNSTLPSGAVVSNGQVIGKIAKYNIARNSTALTSMVSDKILTEDVRIQEINTILLPTDLVEQDFIDVRIMYPSGVEYIVLAQKQVTKIVGSTIWMDMSEEETLMLNSAIVDSFLTQGSKLYAVRYSDPTTQIKLDDTEATRQAKLYIKNEIGRELSTITSLDEVYTVEYENTNTDVSIYNEVNPTAVITATDKILDIVKKYAIEYRYYVESYKKMEANYQPNTQVMAYMKTHPHVVEQAKQRLNESIRQGIETSITLFENENKTDYSSIISGVNGSVSSQQTLRNEALGR